MGFAAETEELLPRARAKLAAKHLDLIVANEVHAGFGGETNAAVLLPRGSDPIPVPQVSKRELADRICDEIVRLRGNAGAPAGAGPVTS